MTTGRARFVGVSNFTGAMLRECLGTRRVDVSQVGYHMFDRRQETETFPLCLKEGIGVMGYGSLGHGLLTGAFTSDTSFDVKNDWRGGGVAFGAHVGGFLAGLALVRVFAIGRDLTRLNPRTWPMRPPRPRAPF